MFKEDNQLFIKRVPPKKMTTNQLNNQEWIPVISEYQSFDSIKKKSIFDQINKSKNRVIFLINLIRDFLKTLITCICIICCSLQIKSLASEYFKYEVVESTGQEKCKQINPPDFSFCFNALGLINVTQLFISRPDVALIAKLSLEKCIKKGDCLFHDENSLILDLTHGPAVVYPNLKISEIISLLPKLDNLLTSCHYLSNNLTLLRCDHSFFEVYLYSQKICFEFVWFSFREKRTPNQLVPVFPSSSVQIPGFLNTKFLSIELNLTRFQGNILLDILAHPKFDVPWNPETGTKELIIGDNQYIIQELTYQKITHLSLPEPYESNCTDYSRSEFRSRRNCLQNCSLNQFMKISNYYPWYFTVRSFDDHFLAFSHEKRLIYQPLIQQLSEKCSSICGLVECHHEMYNMIGLTSARQVSPGMKLIKMRIYPPSQSDTLIRTTPVQTYEYFFASIGGVIGVWFGFSAYQMFTLINRSIPQFYQSIKDNWVNRRAQVVQYKPTIKRFSPKTIKRKQIKIESAK